MKRRVLIASGLAALVAGGVGGAVAALPTPLGMTAPRPAPSGQLREYEVIRSGRVVFRRFQQQVGGIPVLGGERVVTDLPGRPDDLVVDDTRSGIATPLAARVSRSEAVETGWAAGRVRTLRAPARAELTILQNGADGRLVWRVLLPSAAPLASFEVLVDARTGELVRVRDLLQRATGTAALFDPNPVERQQSRSGLADAGDADSPLLSSLRTTLSLPRLSDSNACTANPFTLSGQWAVASLATNEPCAAGLDFSSVTRHDDRFEALMTYAHIDRAQSYIESLGFTNVLNRAQVVGAHAAGDVDNSWFDPTTGELSFGTGGVDDAEDADVIVHEYGHAIQYDQVPGWGNQGEIGAMGEGFGDYLAAALSANFSPGPTFDPCIGEWDALDFGAGLDCRRRADTDLTVADVMASPCSGEVHCAGEAWSGALWDIRAQLGGAAADRLVIQSHFSLTAGADFHEGSRALLAADAALYGGAHQAFLKDLLVSRGLLDEERFDDTPAEAVPLSLPGQASGHLGGADIYDVYRVGLVSGHGLTVALSGSGDFDVHLYPPGSTSVFDAPAAGSTNAGTSSESFDYVPSTSGDFFVAVSAASGSGPYTLAASRLDRDGDGAADELDNCPLQSNPGQEDLDRDGLGDVCDTFPQDAANDADRDGIGANTDNCPRIANASQSDWNHNGRGDACDRAARVTLSRPRIRGRTLTFTGSVRPAQVKPSSWHLRIDRRVCSGRRCRFVRVSELATARRTGSVLQVHVTLRRSRRYRFQAALVNPAYARATSPYVYVTLR